MRNLYLLIILAVLISACKKDKEELVGEFLLGNLVCTNPYNGYETLIYQSTDNDIIRFIGNGRTKVTQKYYTDYYKDRYYIIEVDNCYFLEKNENYEMKITIHSSYSIPHYHLVLRLFDFQSFEYSYYLSLSSYTIPLSDQNLKPYQVHLDSLFVLNKYYYHVFVDTTRLSKSNNIVTRNDSIHPTIFYYNKSHGMLKIDFTDSTSWELKEIIP